MEAESVGASDAVPKAVAKVGKAGTSADYTRGDHEHALDPNLWRQPVIVAKNGVDVGERQEINFVEGSGIILTVAEDAANERTNLTIEKDPAADIRVKSSGGTPTSVGFSGGDETVPVKTKTGETVSVLAKHDSKVYAPAVFDAAASGNLVAAVTDKVTKLHALCIQAQGTVVVNLNDGVAGTSLMEWSFQAREGAVLPLASSPAFWAKTTANTILYVTLSAAVQVTITAIVSSDDAS